MLLSRLYLLRAVVVAAFATLFGVGNLSMLGGVVFLAHQLGGFLGSWVGGVAFDRLGSYELAWTVAIVLSVLAALLNLPIREGASAAEPAKAAA